jgi:hypothetical protein
MNTATNELLRCGVHFSLNDTFSVIGIKSDYLMLGPQRYTGVTRSLVLRKLEEIKVLEKRVKESKLIVSVRYLLSHRGRENDDTLQYIMDSRRCGDG